MFEKEVDKMKEEEVDQRRCRDKDKGGRQRTEEEGIVREKRKDKERYKGKYRRKKAKRKQKK